MKSSALRTAQAGMTLVELLTGLVVASVLFLVAGTMVVMLFRGWLQLQEATGLQRDAVLVVDTIQRAVREANRNHLDPATGRLDLEGPESSRALYVQGDNLVYDPDTATDGDESILVEGRVHAFTSSLEPDAFLYHLELAGSDGRIWLLEGRVRPRN